MLLSRLSLVAAVAAALVCTVHSTPVVGENQSPICVDTSVQIVECQGATTSAIVDASTSYDPDGDLVSFEWSACPGSFIVDPTAAVTEVILDTSVDCNLTCGVRVRVSDPLGLHNACRTFIQVVPGIEGCTPGYWKNHPEAWAAAGFAPTDDFDTVFGVDAFNPDRTLMTALRAGGGGLNKLGRMAGATLLNAAHPGVASARSIGDYINAVRNAVLTQQYEPLATQLDLEANLGCPLN